MNTLDLIRLFFSMSSFYMSLSCSFRSTTLPGYITSHTSCRPQWVFQKPLVFLPVFGCSWNLWIFCCLCLCQTGHSARSQCLFVSTAGFSNYCVCVFFVSPHREQSWHQEWTTPCLSSRPPWWGPWHSSSATSPWAAVAQWVERRKFSIRPPSTSDC